MSTYTRALDKAEPHHVPHQLNIYVLDVDSPCTGYGRHQRLVGPFRGVGKEASIITLREDLLYNLPESTEEDRRRVLFGSDRMHTGRLTYVSSERYDTGRGHESIEHTYRSGRRDA